MSWFNNYDTEEKGFLLKGTDSVFSLEEMKSRIDKGLTIALIERDYEVCDMALPEVAELIRYAESKVSHNEGLFFKSGDEFFSSTEKLIRAANNMTDDELNKIEVVYVYDGKVGACLKLGGLIDFKPALERKNKESEKAISRKIFLALGYGPVEADRMAEDMANGRPVGTVDTAASTPVATTDLPTLVTMSPQAANDNSPEVYCFAANIIADKAKLNTMISSPIAIEGRKPLTADFLNKSTTKGRLVKQPFGAVRRLVFKKNK